MSLSIILTVFLIFIRVRAQAKPFSCDATRLLIAMEFSSSNTTLTNPAIAQLP
jgi:hypothetical protein